MLVRCIMIFPEFDNMSIIDEIRGRYDPLAHHVKPHITLVFPFKSSIESSELKTHLESVLSEVKPFELVLQGITPVRSFGNYLFLGITEGIEEIKNIHERLYKGLLEPIHPQWLKMGGYYPHMTVGKVADDKEYQVAAEYVKHIDDEFRTIVKKVSVEIIDKNEDSLIEMEISLI